MAHVGAIFVVFLLVFLAFGVTYFTSTDWKNL